MSFAGFMLYFLHHLSATASNELQAIPSASGIPDDRQYSFHIYHGGEIDLLLSGYSYGSLILARFPPTQDVVTRFETAEIGTATAEILLRARTLAKQTRQALEEVHTPTSSRGRQLNPADAGSSPTKRIGASPITVGGEETNPAERRRSRDSKRSVDVIRKSVEMPQRIKGRIKHRHDSHEKAELSKTPVTVRGAPSVKTSYLIISPVLLPFSDILLPPGAPTSAFAGKGESPSGKQLLEQPTLAVFGSHDGFTSGTRLKRWAEKESSLSSSRFQWTEIAGAGHFWREEGVLRALQQRVKSFDEEKAQGFNIRRWTG